MQHVRDKVYGRIRLMGRGAAFSNKDFAACGSRCSVDVALHFLLKDGKIRRLARGLYDYPKSNEELGGRLGPDLHQVAKTYARRYGLKIQPDGDWAANLLGLSNQVPSRISYLTDGTTRELTICGNRIYFQHISPGKLQNGKEITVLLTCAIRALGRDAIDAKAVKHLQLILNDSDLRALSKNAKYIETWIYDIVRKIVETENSDNE